MGKATKNEITDLLVAWSGGNPEALAGLMEKVYARLLRLAGSYLRRERNDHTLDASALVHEAFLRLVEQHRVGYRDRAHFFAIAAKLMRRVLIDHARKHASQKRGREVLRVPFEDAIGTEGTRHPNLIALDDALRELEARDEELTELVVLRYFGGMRKEEVAEVMNLSPATVSRRWRTARSFLYDYLHKPPA